VRQLNNSTTCEIIVRVYTNTGSAVPFGNLPGDRYDILDFGDGTSLAVPETAATVRPDLGNSIGYVEFKITHIYPKKGSYIVTYSEPNRNEGILNFTRSVNTRFFLESYFTLDDSYNYESPNFLLAPIFKAGLGDFSQSLAAKDTNDFKLYYDLKSPLQAANTPVNDFSIPSDFSVNQISGTIAWKTQAGKTALGEYGFAVKVSQVKEGKILGYIVRDFQIILNESVPRGSIEAPQSPDANGRMFVPVGDSKKIKVRAERDNSTASNIEIQIHSELQNFPGSLSYALRDSTSGIKVFKIAEIVITPGSQLLRDNPFLISIRVIFSNQAGARGLQDITYPVFTKDFNLFPITAVKDEIANILIYPIPVHTFLSVEVPEDQRNEIIVFDLKGNKQYEAIHLGNSSIDFSSFSKGIYIGTVRTSTGYRSIKIRKE
jgi:hypothetical protein